MKKLCLSMLAIASLRIFAATPLPTQYIAPVTNPTWDAAVFKAPYGTGDGIVFKSISSGTGSGKYYNFLITIDGLGEFTAWSKWVRFKYPNGSVIPDAFEYGDEYSRSVLSAGASAERYLYNACFSDDVGWIVNDKVDIKVSESLLDEGLQVSNQLDNRLNKEQSNYNFHGITLDFSAQYVQCVHTDFVYEVTFSANTNDFSGAMGKFVFTNSAALPANQFAKVGCAFNGWNTREDGGGESYANGSVVDKDLTLYAQWKPQSYTITLDDNGADSIGDTSIKEVTYGRLLPKESIACPTRVGYSFEGYWTGQNGSGKQWFLGNGRRVDDVWDVACDTTLYAYWAGVRFKVLFAMPVDSGYSGSMDIQAFTYGEEQALSSNRFVRAGYSFNGWSRSKDGDAAEFEDMQVVSNLTDNASASLVLYAKWSANDYNVTLDARGGTGGSESVTVKYGNLIPNITPPVQPGFRFAGYYTDEDGGGQQYIDFNGNCTQAWRIDSDRRLYAKWTDITQTVAFDANGGEFSDKSQRMQRDFRIGLPYGDDLPIPMDPNTNTMTFAGWWTSTDPATCVQITRSDIVTEGVSSLYARWKAVVTAETCVLRFELPNGRNPILHRTVEAVVGTEMGMYFPDPAPTADGGRTLYGWYAGGVRVKETDVVTGAATLTADWTIGAFNSAWNCRDIKFQTTGDGDAGGWTIDADRGVARSGDMPSDVPGESTSTLIMSAETSGKLSVEWKVSCPPGEPGPANASLDFYIPPISYGLIDRITGDQGFFTCTQEAIVNLNDTVYLEYYRNDGADVSGYKDCGWARNLKWTPDRTPTPVDDWTSFSAMTTSVPKAVWSTGGAVSWATSADDADVAAAGSITNSRSSWLKLETPAAKGVLSFKWKTSCEAGYVDTNGVYQACDYLEFFDERGGSQRLLLDGIQDDWTTVAWTNDVDSSHAFTWRYVKDGDAAAGDDAAWVKDVVWTPLSPRRKTFQLIIR